jgi:hypothetical protein
MERYERASVKTYTSLACSTPARRIIFTDRPDRDHVMCARRRAQRPQ